MKTLSSEDEARIAAALEDVVERVEAGASPNEAMAKAASDRGVPPGHVRLMVNAYNVGRSGAQRRGGSTLAEKAGEFEVANAVDVLERMYPSAVKTAGVLFNETALSSDYSRPPEFVRDRDRVAGAASFSFAKTAAAEPAASAYEGKRARVEVGRLLAAHSLLEEKRRAAQAEFDTVTTKIAALTNHLKTERSVPFAAARRVAVGQFGKTAEALFDHMAAGSSVLIKRASGPTGPAAEGDLCARVGDVLRAADRFAAARTEYEKTAAAHEETVGAVARPFVPAQEGGSVLGPSSIKKCAFLGGLFGTMLGSSVGRAVGEKAFKPTENLQAKTLKQMTDPSHESEMRNIQTTALLNDLMANDPVISGSDPNEVTGYFNEIAQLSPRAVNQTGLMRALLRKRLQQGALDPFEVDMLLKIENGLRARDGASSGGVLNGSSGVM